MRWSLTLASFLIVGVQASFLAPIRLGRGHASMFLQAPEPTTFLNKDLPRTLTVGVARDGVVSDSIPFFSARSDNTIATENYWCIEASGHGDGDAVQLSKCTGGSTQRWNWLPQGMGQMQLQGTNKCVNVAGKDGESGASLELRECDHKASEVWAFEEVIPSSPSSFLRHMMLWSLGMAVLGALGFSGWFGQGLKKKKARMMEDAMSAGFVSHSEEGGVALTEPASVPAVMAVGPVPDNGDNISLDESNFVQSASRRTMLMGALALGVSATTEPASAGYVTSYGLETVDPKDTEIDDELVKTKEVKDSIEKIKGYQSAAASIKEQFKKDTAMQLGPSIRKDLDLSKVRQDFNNVNKIFDDDTQETFDRLTRSIVYDIGELENAARVKKDVPRTEKQAARVEGWLNNFDRDISKALKYFP